MKIALTLAAGLLAASSMAFAADNNGGNNNSNKGTDATNTGSIKSDDGNTVPLSDREFCVANPSDSKCQNLGGEMNK